MEMKTNINNYHIALEYVTVRNRLYSSFSPAKCIVQVSVNNNIVGKENITYYTRKAIFDGLFFKGS
ncbi:hypothetical protein GCM10023184_28440 [Flaviaesturariibacter amylovorans]|uniref:Uncharacterized protein n=1 Tax=Flaviaesturariibacter amylovorans TaxID=1084520 RepID=A0ABP8H500_9BACT